MPENFSVGFSNMEVISDLSEKLRDVCWSVRPEADSSGMREEENIGNV